MSAQPYLQTTWFRSLFGVWWVQWSLGLALTLFALLPWLSGDNLIQLGAAGELSPTPSLLPHAAYQSSDLWVAQGMCALLGGFFVRALSGRNLRFLLLVLIGSACGWLGAGYHSLTVLNSFAAGRDTLPRHLLVFGLGLVCLLLLFWIIARLQMCWVALSLALLSFVPGFWLDQLWDEVPWQLPIQHLGPLLLGIVLGVLGFERIVALAFWIAALVIQWLAPVFLNLLSAQLATVDATLTGTRLWEVFSAHALEPQWITASIITLAGAMILSVLLVLLRRIRHR
ncbi:hypothetical protein [Glutamicibacter uratoxydans]|uniref:hypothetical protein n=1 Tax=Glutamicibacter uratoxydans TaxID=43667 RepID=UPI003D6ECE50